MESLRISLRGLDINGEGNHSGEAENVINCGRLVFEVPFWHLKSKGAFCDLKEGDKGR